MPVVLGSSFLEYFISFHFNNSIRVKNSKCYMNICVWELGRMEQLNFNTICFTIRFHQKHCNTGYESSLSLWQSQAKHFAGNSNGEESYNEFIRIFGYPIKVL